MRWIFFILVCLAAAPASLQAAPAAVLTADEEFVKKVRPLLEKYCYECHNAEKHKGDLNLRAYETLDQVLSAPDVFATALERLQAFEMPPDAKDMSSDRNLELQRFFRALPQPDRTDCNQLATDRSATFYRGYVMSRRLNRAEYRNTVRDLFGMSFTGIEELLPEDGGGGEGFDTAGNALFTSTIHIEQYMAAADRILETILPAKYGGPSRKEARPQAHQVVERFARRAFRRPVSNDEVERALVLFDRVYARGDGFVPAIRLSLKSILISPNFLFLAEPEPAERGIQALAAAPLASKLSYFLWSTMPDAELSKLAESGELLQTNIYRAQIKRMLADARAAALGDRFAMQWLEIDRLGSEVNPDPVKFPEFDSLMRDSMRQEVATVFNYVIQNDRPLTELLDANYTFVNERLAGLYGMPNVRGDQLQKVSLTSKTRGGVTGMAAVHALTSFPLRTSPVLRGRWILEALLGEKVPPPPPDVPALEASAKDLQNASLREQLSAHRLKAECASCHNKMDPLGFGLENFDNLGRWRDRDGAHPVDARGTLPSGESFTGPDGLKKILVDRKDQVMKHLARKMAGYAFGRELNKFDECVVDRALEAMQKNEYRPSVLVEQIALSFPFRHRFYPKHD